MRKLKLALSLPILNTACGLSLVAVTDYSGMSLSAGAGSNLAKTYAAINAPAAIVVLLLNEEYPTSPPIAALEFLLVSTIVWYGIGRFFDARKESPERSKHTIPAVIACGGAALLGFCLLLLGVFFAANANTYHDPGERMGEAAVILVWSLILLSGSVWQFRTSRPRLSATRSNDSDCR